MAVKRGYSTTTIRTLFGKCGNECAAPDCLHEIVVEGTEKSDEAIAGQICHIYAISEDGPRGKSGLTAAEKNAYANLILLCGHHHPIVDKQWKTYPATTLQTWKQKHEAKFTEKAGRALKVQGALEHQAFALRQTDEQIAADVDRLRKARFLGGFDGIQAAERLSSKVLSGELSGGSQNLRAKALAWCSRILSVERTSFATQLLQAARELANIPEIELAASFLLATSDFNQALASLHRLGTPEARSAALLLVARVRGTVAAVDWMSATGLHDGDLDAEGVALFLKLLVEAERWEAAESLAEKISEEQYEAAPNARFFAAVVSLAKATPAELRAAVWQQIPFDAARIPLADGDEALLARRTAEQRFRAFASVATSLGADGVAKVAMEFAIWLALRDPAAHIAAKQELQRDDAESVADALLCWVRYTVRLGGRSTRYRTIDRPQRRAFWRRQF